MPRNDDLGAYIDRDFPARIVDAWKARVADVPGWDAGIRPLGEDGQVFYTLTAEYAHHGVSERVILAGPSQDDVIRRAEMFVQYWEAVTTDG